MTKQSENKNIPELRFPEFKDDGEWEERQLGKLGHLVGGGTPDRSVSEFWTGSIPWVSSSDIIEDNIHDIRISRFINESAIKVSATKLVPKGSVLFVSRVGVGKLAVNQTVLCTSQDFTSFISKGILNYFVGYYFMANKSLLYSMGQGTSIRGFSKNDLECTKLSFPRSSLEQQKIADTLSSLDEIITAQSDKLEVLKDYKKGLMQVLFPQEGEKVPKYRFPEFQDDRNWEIKRFSNYITLFRGSSPRPIQEYLTKSDKGVNWIKIGDTKNAQNFILFKVEERITQEGALKSREVYKGELILANSMSFGKTYFLEIDGCIYDGWFVLRDYEKYFDKLFLLQLLNSKYMQAQYEKLSAGGIVQNISSEIVYNTMLPHTSREEQQKIAETLSSLDNLIAAQSEKIDQLKAHKKGLMQKLFPAIKE